MDATAKKLGIPVEKMVTTVDRHANTSAASIPLALDLAVRDGRIRFVLPDQLGHVGLYDDVNRVEVEACLDEMMD
jgi:3-dehydroquinate synthetase